MLTPIGSDFVLVQHPVYNLKAKITVAAWFKETDAAIRVRQQCEKEGRKPETWNERFAALWLQACELQTTSKIEDYLKRRARLDSPADMPSLVRCAKCGRPLSDKISIALGVGTVCRKKSK